MGVGCDQDGRVANVSNHWGCLTDVIRVIQTEVDRTQQTGMIIDINKQDEIVQVVHQQTNNPNAQTFAQWSTNSSSDSPFPQRENGNDVDDLLAN